MTNELKEIETPQWMLDLFKSIDDLDTSATSGFRIFADDIVLQFGPKTTHGLENVKKFFVELDAPFITRHLVDVAYRYDTANYVAAYAASKSAIVSLTKSIAIGYAKNNIRRSPEQLDGCLPGIGMFSDVIESLLYQPV